MLWRELTDSVSRGGHDERVAVVADGAQLTYAALLHRSDRLADALAELGVGPGCVVLACLDNQPAFLVTLLATARLQATFAPIDLGSTDQEARPIVQLTGAQLIVCAPDDVKRCQAWVPCVVTVNAEGEAQAAMVETSPAASLDGTAGCIQFSSGTTGTSKAIVLGHDAFHYRSAFLADALELGSRDRTLCTLPLSHTHGAECLALPTLLSGGTLHLLSPQFAFPLYVLQELSARGITFFSTIPNFYDFAVKLQESERPDLSALRLPFCGSAALSRATAEAFYERYGVQIRQGYGLAELSVICVNFQPPEELAYDSVGKPLPGIDWKLDPPGDEGELWVRSRAQFSGYLHDAEATADRLHAGWLRTGDVVSVDEQGLFRIVGRKEDFIKVRGFKVYASEVETAAVGVPWVRECAVLCDRDEQGAESIVAHVVVGEGGPPRERLASALAQALRPVLSEHKLPRRCVAWESLPKSAMGKVLKSRIGAERPETQPTEGTP